VCETGTAEAPTRKRKSNGARACEGERATARERERERETACAYEREEKGKRTRERVCTLPFAEPCVAVWSRVCDSVWARKGRKGECGDIHATSINLFGGIYLSHDYYNLHNRVDCI